MIKNIKIFSLKLFLLILISFVFSSNLDSFAWTASPVKFELKGERGKEYTLSFSVLNESQLNQKRFKITVDNWGLDKRGNFVIESYSMGALQIKNSAIPWIKVTPTQFVVPPGGTRKIRFTVTIPPDVVEDGDYTAGLFVAEENIEKPPKGERVVFIKQNTLIGVVLYTQVGEPKKDVFLSNVLVDSVPAQIKGFSNVSVLPVFENMSNVHLRGNIKLTLTPSPDQVLTEEQKTAVNNIEKEFLFEDSVLLRDSYIEYPLTISQPLPENTEWTFEVKADFGKELPLLVGKKKFTVPVAPPEPAMVEPVKPTVPTDEDIDESMDEDLENSTEPAKEKPSELIKKPTELPTKKSPSPKK